MASSISFNGQQFRPNVYTKVLVSEGPAQASTGAVAIVGDFPELKPDTPKTFTNKLEQNAYFLNSSENLELIADLVYRPTADLNSSVQSLTIVNANRSTQASKAFGSITLKSKLYGPFGNRIKTSITTNGDLYDLSVKVGSEEVEKVVAIGEGNIASIGYTKASTFSEMLLEINAADLTVTGKITNIAEVTAEFNQNLLSAPSVASGVVTLTTTDAQTTDTIFEIAGTTLNGSVVTETVTIPSGDSTIASTNSFSEITSIHLPDDTLNGVLAEIKFPVYTKALADITDFGETLTDIQNLNNDIEGTFVVTTPARTLKGTDIDQFASADISTTRNFTQNVKTISDWFNTSQYVEATVDSRAGVSASEQRLTSGFRETSVSDASFRLAFNSLKTSTVNIVVPFSNAISVHDIAKKAEAVYERNIWVGSTANETVEQVVNTYASQLNDRNVAVVCQSIKLTNGKTYGPEYLALVLASMQGATSVGTPLTRKRPTPLIVETVQNFDVEAKASYAIQNGVILLTDPRGTGLNIERSVTTFQDDNRVFSEVSANESLNIAVRTVRADLQSQIGTKITGGKANDIRRIVSATLRDLTKVGFILSFKDIDVSISNDTANVSFAISVIQPLNFIVATINVG